MYVCETNTFFYQILLILIENLNGKYIKIYFNVHYNVTQRTIERNLPKQKLVVNYF